MDRVSDKYDVGVVVGRFQVHDLHEGHRDLIQHVCQSHSKVLVVLGKAPVPTSARDPLPYEAREQMVRGFAPGVSVTYVLDCASDEAWSTGLDQRVTDFLLPGQNAVIYGSRDSFVEHYHGRFPVVQLEGAGSFSGTAARAEVAKGITRDSADFRAGVIWASQARYPVAFCTVDVAAFDGDGNVLMGRKPGERKWRFIGGFSDPSSPSLEADARREVAEETGVTVDDIRYVGSTVVEDWRYQSAPDCIKTTLFTAKIIFGAPKGADDIAEAKLLDFSKLTRDDVEAVHQPLYDMLVSHLTKEPTR